eukprot:483027-Hanusia_phi.AAC.1
MMVPRVPRAVTVTGRPPPPGSIRRAAEPPGPKAPFLPAGPLQVHGSHTAVLGWPGPGPGPIRG